MIQDAVLEKINHLPTTPGVYLWRDDYGRIIYVGKAINLRSRVRSYVRQDSRRMPKVTAMMKHAVDVEVIKTDSELEALVLENNLIKEHRPRYNILLKDDKTYPYIKVSVQDSFPRVFMTREVLRDGAKYYGPFTSGGNVHRVLRYLHDIFPLRTCRSMQVDRPCLQYHMKRCEAPCMGWVKEEAYGKSIARIVDFLEGKPSDIVSQVKADMLAASESLDFEVAAEKRDLLAAMDHVRERQRVDTAAGEYDVVGVATDATMGSIQILFVRGGRLVGRENFFVSLEGEGEEAIVSEFLKQYYASKEGVGKELLLPLELGEKALFEEWLSQKSGRRVYIQVPQRGYKRGMVQMAEENANNFLMERRRQWRHELERTGGAVTSLAEVLGLSRTPERMECFDISHNQGAETVASMVVFEGGRPAKKEYRRFKLKTTQGKPDDFASMAEIMERRYGKERNWPMPDLIIIDGGKGQLGAALPIIRQMGVEDVPVISLAKRIEEVFVEGQSESIILSHHTPALQLLQQIRDEAHRFAITYHRSLRRKRNMKSLLDAVEGIGPKRRQALWKAFPNLEAMKAATVDELASVEGMNRKAAERVANFLSMNRVEKADLIK